jgi:hypothetical protein
MALGSPYRFPLRLTHTKATMTLESTLVLGFVGGLLPDLIRLIRDRDNPEWKAFAKTAKFWLSLLALALLGAFIAWLLDAASKKDAVIYGFTAPEVLSKLVGSSAKESDRSVTERRTMTIREWWGR